MVYFFILVTPTKTMNTSLNRSAALSFICN